MLAPIIVNSALDNGEGGNTTLREAIDAANFNPDADTIQFASSLANATITLTQGQLNISSEMTIDGTGRNITLKAHDPDSDGTNDGDGSRIFDVTDPSFANFAFTLRHLTLTNSDVTGNGGAIQLANYTAPPYSPLSGQPTLTLENCVITDNHATGEGGGIFAPGPLTIRDSLITGNRSSGFGGGVRFAGASGEDLDITSTIFRDNHTNSAFAFTTGGGGLTAEANHGEIYIDKSTFADNTVTGPDSFGAGALIEVNNATLKITATKVSGNETVGSEANVGGIGIGEYNYSLAA
jgi:hypothetical protein